MVNGKKGWLRVAEAFIAIILIVGFLVVLYSKTEEKPRRDEEIYKLQKTILDEIAADPKLREGVLNNKTGEIISFVSRRIPYRFNFTIRICSIDKICGLQYYQGDTYSSERIISSVLEKYEPKKLKIFMWQEK
jgi:hypothetical protein